MPNARVLSEKQAIVEELTRRLSSASAGVFVDYRGITVAEDTQLRRELAQNAVQYSVVKNTLTKFAVDKVGLEGLIISEYSKKMGDRFNIKAAFMDGKVLGAQEIEEIAALPSKDALYAKVLGTMLAPITSLAVVLGQIVEKSGGSVESADTAEAEAPAAE